MSEETTPLSRSASPPCSGEWKLMDHDEWRKVIRWQDCTVSLRVLLGGNDRRTPMVEIIADRARVVIGPKGRKKPPSKYVDGCLLPQRDSIDEAKSDVEKWWAAWSPPEEKRGAIIGTCGHELADNDGPGGMGYGLAVKSHARDCSPAVDYITVCAACRDRWLASGDVLEDDAAKEAWLHQNDTSRASCPEI